MSLLKKDGRIYILFDNLNKNSYIFSLNSNINTDFINLRAG